jgi:hypothetical protein
VGAGPAVEEWRVTLKGPRLELMSAERLSDTPGEVKEFVVSIDPRNGLCSNIEVIEGGTRRALSEAEYAHLVSIYLATYATAAYGQHDEAAAEYWRSYFGNIMTTGSPPG